MFHVERMTFAAPSRRICVFLLLGRVASVQPLGMPCWASGGGGRGSLVRVLVAWSSSSGGALLGLSVTLVDVVDAAQHAARRTRYSWPLVSPREVTALPRSAEGYPSVL